MGLLERLLAAAPPIPPALITPSPTNGQVLTTVAHATAWANPPSGGGGGGASVTGTGLLHATGGALDPGAYQAVDADIDAAAAIALSKVAPGGSDGLVATTVGGVSAWAAPSGSIPSGTGLRKVASGVETVATLVNADVAANANVAVAKMAPGTDGQLLWTQDVSGTPTTAWKSPQAGDGTTWSADGTILKVNVAVASQADGDMLCRASGALARIPGGASGKVLVSNGASVAPSWQTSPGGSIPTGTGLRHVTSGAEDGATVLVTDAMVDAAAAIAAGKIAPGSNGQVMLTAGGVTSWGSVGSAALQIASATVSFGTSGNVDTTVYTVPASPSGSKRFMITEILVRVGTALVGAGSVAMTVGATAGGVEYLLSQAITSAIAAGTTYGADTTELGASMLPTKGYRAMLDASAPIVMRLATTGTVTAGAVTITLYGYPIN